MKNILDKIRLIKETLADIEDELKKSEKPIVNQYEICDWCSGSGYIIDVSNNTSSGTPACPKCAGSGLMLPATN